jgi:hypothetical protein
MCANPAPVIESSGAQVAPAEGIAGPQDRPGEGDVLSKYKFASIRRIVCATALSGPIRGLDAAGCGGGEPGTVPDWRLNAA